MIQSLSALVISLNNEYRNSNLISQLYILGFSHFGFMGVDGRKYSSNFVKNNIDVKACKISIGRLPTRPEIGCYMSHMLAYNSLLAKSGNKNQWFLILEDDANPNRLTREYESLLNCIDIEQPNIITLYTDSERNFSEITNIDSQNTDYSRLGRFYTPPSSTLAYFVNTSALKILTRYPKITGVADWPLYSYQINYWSTENNLCEEIIGASSLISQSRHVANIARPKRDFTSSHSSKIWFLSIPAFVLLSRYNQGIRGYTLYILIPIFQRFFNRLFKRIKSNSFIFT